MGYTPQVQSVRVTRDCFIRTRMKPLLFEIEEITVESGKRENELGELTPSNLLAFSGGDLFSQIWILPGVTSSLAGQNFMVDGGGYDENLLLLRLGVYNVVENPSEEDILSFYSVHWRGNCLPYGSISFKF